MAVARRQADLDALVCRGTVVGEEKKEELSAFDGDAAVVGRARLSVLRFLRSLSWISYS